MEINHLDPIFFKTLFKFRWLDGYGVIENVRVIRYLCFDDTWFVCLHRRSSTTWRSTWSTANGNPWRTWYTASRCPPWSSWRWKSTRGSCSRNRRLSKIIMDTLGFSWASARPDSGDGTSTRIPLACSNLVISVGKSIVATKLSIWMLITYEDVYVWRNGVFYIFIFSL